MYVNLDSTFKKLMASPRGPLIPIMVAIVTPLQLIVSQYLEGYHMLFFPVLQPEINDLLSDTVSVSTCITLPKIGYFNFTMYLSIKSEIILATVFPTNPMPFLKTCVFGKEGSKSTGVIRLLNRQERARYGNCPWDNRMLRSRDPIVQDDKLFVTLANTETQRSLSFSVFAQKGKM